MKNFLSKHFWFRLWYLLALCRSVMELGLQNLQYEEPYINEFHTIVMKLFTMYDFSSELDQGKADFAVFNDNDFTKITGLDKIRWAQNWMKIMQPLPSRSSQNFEQFPSPCHVGSY